LIFNEERNKLVSASRQRETIEKHWSCTCASLTSLHFAAFTRKHCSQITNADGQTVTNNIQFATFNYFLNVVKTVKI